MCLFVLNYKTLHVKVRSTQQKIEYRNGLGKLAMVVCLIDQLGVFHLYFKHDYNPEISTWVPNEKQKMKKGSEDFLGAVVKTVPKH